MILRLHGGLGNQLFQLLAARYLSKEKNEQVEIYVSDLDKFTTKREFEIEPLLKDEKVIEAINPVDSVLFKYKVSKALSNFNVHSISNVEDISSWKGQYLNGYFQDIYNFKNKKLVSEIVDGIQQAITHYTANTTSAGQPDFSSICAIHFRLTDFIHQPRGEEFLKQYRTPYILKSVKYLQTEFAIKKFVVFTDDVLLAKKILGTDAFSFFNDFAPAPASLLEEFSSLSLYKYLITSNSTFSFWSSVIGNDKTIVFPSLWKHDDKRENTIFKKNIALHGQIFPRNNRILSI